MVVRHRYSATSSTRLAIRHRLGVPAATLLAITAALTATSSGLADPAPPVPRPDPHDRNGAWAGWSIRTNTRDVNAPAPDGTVLGMDVSSHQGAVDWDRAWAQGARFAYVKATEGTDYRNDFFDQQYAGSAAVGMLRGAYHFALPDRSPGAEQATRFVDHGGHWRGDGRTLPGALDIEDNPYGDQCYGMTPQELVGWIAEFSSTYHARTGRHPVIYTSTRWWNDCTGGNEDFGANHPLWIPRYAAEIGPLPAGWQTHTIWQFSNNGPLPGDQNAFNGSPEQLTRFAG